MVVGCGVAVRRVVVDDVVVGWLWWLDGCGGWMVVEVEVVGFG